MSAVTIGTRTWQYEYTAENAFDHTLAGVLQPDGSRWSISFAGLMAADVDGAN